MSLFLGASLLNIKVNWCYLTCINVIQPPSTPVTKKTSAARRPSRSSDPTRCPRLRTSSVRRKAALAPTLPVLGTPLQKPESTRKQYAICYRPVVKGGVGVRQGGHAPRTYVGKINQKVHLFQNMTGPPPFDVMATGLCSSANPI